MNGDRLLEGLARGHDVRGFDCPDDAWLAAYADGVLDGAAREAISAHLSDCVDCRRILGDVLAIAATADRDARVPELLGARARRLVGRRPGFTPVWAAAAAMLLAVGAVLLLRPAPHSDIAEQSFETVRQSRFVPQERLVPHIAQPVDNDVVVTGALAVRWTAVPGARYYAVRIVDEDGDVVLEERVAGTEWKPGDAGVLASGADYFVRVDAYLDDAKPQSSPHVLFKIVP